jgi:hypothetical protein
MIRPVLAAAIALSLSAYKMFVGEEIVHVEMGLLSRWWRHRRIELAQERSFGSAQAMASSNQMRAVPISSRASRLKKQPNGQLRFLLASGSDTSLLRAAALPKPKPSSHARLNSTPTKSTVFRWFYRRSFRASSIARLTVNRPTNVPEWS